MTNNICTFLCTNSQFCISYNITLGSLILWTFTWEVVRKSQVYFFHILHWSCLSPLTLGSPSPPEAGSDSVHTDLDDQHSSVSEPRRESSKSSNNSSNSVNAAGRKMPPYEELTPIYVIKNLVVKPVRYSVTHTNYFFRNSTLLHQD